MTYETIMESFDTEEPKVTMLPKNSSYYNWGLTETYEITQTINAAPLKTNSQTTQ